MMAAKEYAGEVDASPMTIELMKPIGLVEVSRTGVAAIGRGPEGM